MFRVEEHGGDYSAKAISGAAYIPGEGMRDPASEAALSAGFANGRFREVTRLYRGAGLPNLRWRAIVEADCSSPRTRHQASVS
jgi:hypothetical protein